MCVFLPYAGVRPNPSMLFHLQDKDTLADLQSCLYYYENVAESGGDPKREEEIKANSAKISQIIEKLQENVKCRSCSSHCLPASL